MERLLDDRGRAGISDAVLLEDFTNEDVFIENLEKRFDNDYIYVRINLQHCDVIVNILIPINYLFFFIANWLQTKYFSFCCIQTYIGQVLISVNPYKELPIYSEEIIETYKRKYFFEVPPHV